MKFRSVLAHLFHPRRSNNHRPRVLHPEALVALVAVAISFTGLVYGWTNLPDSTGAVLGYASSISPAQVVEMSNAERQKAGLKPLVLNAQLSNAAAGKAGHMFANQYWAHTAPDGTQPWTFIKNAGYGYQVAGENLARDFSDTSSMMSAWMASPTHRANIVSSKYQEIGVAVVDGTLQGVETTLVVQMFGAKRVAVAQTGPAASPAVKAQTVTIEQRAPEVSPVVVAEPTPTAVPEPEVIGSDQEVPQPTAVGTATEALRQPAVLASVLVPQGSITVPPLFTPLQLLKAFFLGLIMMIILTLVYDGFVIGHRSALRLVGKNIAHIILLGAVAFLMIFFKGGIIA